MKSAPIKGLVKWTIVIALAIVFMVAILLITRTYSVNQQQLKITANDSVDIALGEAIRERTIKPCLSLSEKEPVYAGDNGWEGRVISNYQNSKLLCASMFVGATGYFSACDTFKNEQDKIRCYQGYPISEPVATSTIDGMPVIYEKPEAGSGEVVYSVCKSQTTEKRVLSWSQCGMDTCAVTYYDENGFVVEHVPVGDGSKIFAFEPKTKVKDCFRTIKNLFIAQIKDKRTLPSQ